MVDKLNLQCFKDTCFGKTDELFLLKVPVEKLEAVIFELRGARKPLIERLEIFSDDRVGVISFQIQDVRIFYEELFDFLKEETKRSNFMPIYEPGWETSRFCWTYPYKPMMMQAHEVALSETYK